MLNTCVSTEGLRCQLQLKIHDESIRSGLLIDRAVETFFQQNWVILGDLLKLTFGKEEAELRW